MARATLESARTLTTALLKALDPQSIIVFGGVGREGAGDDLDLLILLDDDDENNLNRSRIVIRSVLKDFSKLFDVDPFIMPSSLFKTQFRKGSPFLKTVIREGRLLYIKNAETEWMSYAREELRTADYLFQGKFWKAACYHAQQSAEKCLKARLLGKGWELEKVYIITRLTALLEDYAVRIEIQDDEVEYIDSIYRGRYPGEAGLLPLGEPSQEDAQKAVNIARKLLAQGSACGHPL